MKDGSYYISCLVLYALLFVSFFFNICKAQTTSFFFFFNLVQFIFFLGGLVSSTVDCYQLLFWGFNLLVVVVYWPVNWIPLYSIHLIEGVVVGRNSHCISMS